MGNQTSQWGLDFKADSERSTYRWVITFTNGKQIYGYSRKQGKPEVSDKVKLLKRKIIMLSKNNYLDPSKALCLEFFKRTDIGEYNDKLFTMFPQYYQLHNNVKFNNHDPIISFLDMVYNQVKLGTLNQLDYKSVGYSKIKEDDLFSMKSGRFADLSQLQKFCRDMSIEGFPFERIQHFQREYFQKFLDNTIKFA
jgi:hypothetical protein